MPLSKQEIAEIIAGQPENPGAKNSWWLARGELLVTSLKRAARGSSDREDYAWAAQQVAHAAKECPSLSWNAINALAEFSGNGKDTQFRRNAARRAFAGMLDCDEDTQGRLVSMFERALKRRGVEEAEITRLVCRVDSAVAESAPVLVSQPQ